MYKICHFSSVHPADDIRVFHKECKSLAAAGFEVALIIQNKCDEIVDGVKLRALKRPKNRFSRILVLPMIILVKCLKERSNLYHFHDPELIPVGILLKFCGKKVVYDVHENYVGALKHREWIHPFLLLGLTTIVSLAERIGNKIFDGIVAVTPAISQQFSSPNTITLQNYPVFDQNFQPCAYEERENILVYIGVISAQRCIHEILEAIERLPSGLNIQLHIAGVFDNDALEKTCFSSPGWSKVKYHGWLSQDGIRDLLDKARAGIVLFAPLPNHIESQPNKLFEYMSHGLPVIASNFPLWRQLIIDEEICGLVVNPLCAEEISDSMAWIIQNPSTAKEMGTRGRQAITDKFNWKVEFTKLTDLYTKILKS